MSTKVRVGSAQGEPVWLDLQGSVEKTTSLIKSAAADGVKVLGFPDVWIPGYPWTTSVIGSVEMIHKYMANSLIKDSPEMRHIQTAEKEASMFVMLGYSERDGASLYMAQSFISPEGDIPTHVERMLRGDEQADSLKTVVDSPFGRIGGLNCWEHLQPLLRYYEYSQRVQIHVASWPAEFEMPDPEKQPWLYHETGEASYQASHFMAFEGQTFVLVTLQIITEENLEKNNLLVNHPGGGFFMIFGPDGKALGEPTSTGAEAILKADIDYAKIFIDTVGHYARPDMLSLLGESRGGEACNLHEVVAENGDR
ncbi:carbon-nitrogen hydrolase [Lentithecium fluviatile CBS 122367]|uniref:nitrilase n=1 Tax=Lentithecium fluviatile CBS 122367 TaxID=1168545 RepID=A0A6G1J8Z6_9PLEO|nr:carbon-nitrogen hydrolase [Lentithecium fluviatile CBS 122367]